MPPLHALSRRSCGTPPHGAGQARARATVRPDRAEGRGRRPPARPAVFLRALAAGALALTSPAALAFTVIQAPVSSYVGSTALVPMPGAVPEVSGLSEPGVLEVRFSSALVPRRVPESWSTWGSLPETETAAPEILWARRTGFLALSFSRPLAVWGFEIQPNAFLPFTITAQFFSGPVRVGEISREVSGLGGARLFAAEAGTGLPFTRVTVEAPAEFAIARLRFVPAAIIPEPSGWALLITGFGLAGAVLRARKAGQGARAAPA